MKAESLQVKSPSTRKPSTGGQSLTVLVYGFAAVIIAGAILLMLPSSSRAGNLTSPVNALFTATSAVCTTGLVVVDTGTYWSTFGQGVILLLIQVGGLGFMTAATLFLLVLGRRIGLRERLLISQSIGLPRLGGVVRIVRRIALFTFFTEAAGAVILFFAFLPRNPIGTAFWRALFHSLSAFNNAGFDLFGNFRSLLDFQKDSLVLLTIAALAFVGATGYIVIDDFWRVRRIRRLSADSKMVLSTTVALALLGTVFYFASEAANPDTLGKLPLPYRFMGAFFQSLTARTPGFSAIDIGKMRDVSLVFTMFLMFIGGASGSTAGGIKVGTFGILVTAALSSMRGREHTEAFGREITPQLITRALALATVSLTLITVISLVLAATEGAAFISILFEAFSALGTVGLSTGITPSLSTAGRLILIPTMFVGRLGPLVLTSLLVQRQRPSSRRYPQAVIRIG